MCRRWPGGRARPSRRSRPLYAMDCVRLPWWVWEWSLGVLLSFVSVAAGHRAAPHPARSVLEEGLDVEAGQGAAHQSAGAAIGLTPDRSSRVTRIVTSVMTSASAMIPAATMYPLENPVAMAWFTAAFCSAAAWPADRCTVAVLAAAAAADTCERRLFATALQATVPSTASPSAPPICWPTLTRLEATPVSLSATLVSETTNSGAKISPRPAAVSNIGPSRPEA